MKRTIDVIVTDESDSDRLDTFLGSLTSIASRSAAVRLIESGKVTVNREVCTVKKTSVYEGDHISIEMPEATTAVLRPQFIPLDIRYEDDYLIVLSKEEGMVCHPSKGHSSGTLANALLGHCGIDNLGTLQGEDRPGIVHRLDKDTTGLMVAAKDDETQKALQSLIARRDLDRRYIALVHGMIAPDKGLIDAPIGRHERLRTKMAVTNLFSGREALTTFAVLERFEAFGRNDGYSLVECKLATGRTHQIRVHMSYIRHALVGDPIYGRKFKDPRPNLGLQRQFLHSYRLGLNHPQTDERLEFLDTLPEDLANALNTLSSHSMGTTEYGEQVKQKLAHGSDVFRESDVN